MLEFIQLAIQNLATVITTATVAVTSVFIPVSITPTPIAIPTPSITQEIVTPSPETRLNNLELENKENSEVKTQEQLNKERDEELVENIKKNEKEVKKLPSQKELIEKYSINEQTGLSLMQTTKVD